MRPLIEILEDERALRQKLESLCRYLVKTDDCETINILESRLERIEKDLAKVRNEMREYIDVLTNGGEDRE
jgi:hypothetical protein